MVFRLTFELGLNLNIVFFSFEKVITLINGTEIESSLEFKMNKGKKDRWKKRRLKKNVYFWTIGQSEENLK